MQGYMYSVFSAVAIAIHLIINYRLISRPGTPSPRGETYRGFLIAVLVYYVSDAAWGVFAGLRWMALWYVDTIFFFLSLAAFVFMWCRFVVVYLGLGSVRARIVRWSGYALLAFNAAALAVNPFFACMFHFNKFGVYKTDFLRDPAISLLVAYDLLIAAFVLAKVLSSRGDVRRRGMMVFMFSVTIALSIVLQVVWPLTPFTALGCLVGNCFLHVFVIQDEQARRHMAELEKALARAREAEKARSEFFSVVSHDIRTPLNAILGYSELLQNGAGGGEGREEALKSIKSAGKALLELVNDVLDLAKMDAGLMEFRLEAVRLDSLVENVFASFRHVAGSKGLALRNRTVDVPALMLDGLRFRQILFNLVGNAVKFTGSGTVSVCAAYGDGRLEVAVEDTGCGIAPEMVDRVFDPFVQGQDVKRPVDRAGGAGLGLPICKRLVEAMGGTLSVESEPGRGSKFTLRISGVAPAEATPPPGAAKPRPVKAKMPGRVLVVDDSPVNRLVLAAFLKKAGIAAIDQAGDGREAFEALEAAKGEGKAHDFVLSDCWMPNMNGYEFIEKIRADPRFRNLPVVAVTADTEYRTEPRSGLFDGVLLKPLAFAKLVDALASVRCDGAPPPETTLPGKSNYDIM